MRGSQPEAVQRTPAARLIVDDAAADVAPGQMRRSDFLRQLRGEVTQTAAAGLEAAGRSTHDCPYLRIWFAHYRGRSAAALQRDVRRYAPETARASDAGAYVTAVGARVRQAVDTWVETGEVSGVPMSLRGAVAMRTLPGRLGSGRPLDEGTRQRMESVLRSDFSRVRVHTEKEGAALSQRMQAQAVTVGDDIAFAPGSYAPGTPMGDAILAHELAHVVQQQPGGERSGRPTLEPQGSPYEREAEGAAVGAVATLWGPDREGARPLAARARPTLRSPRRFQRCGYTVEHKPHTFKSCGFGASGGGPLRIADDTRATRTQEQCVVLSQPVSSSGKVGIEGGTDNQAREWDAGFVQTALSSKREFEYRNASGVRRTRVDTLPGARRDGAPGTPEPWPRPTTPRPFTKTESKIEQSFGDSPICRRGWQGVDDAGAPQGDLRNSRGLDQFCTWMVVRHRPTAAVLFLNWATWEVDWAASYRPNSRSGKPEGKGTTFQSSGDGKGSKTPVLTGPVAEQEVQHRWVP